MPMLLRERGGRCAGEDMLHNRIFEGAWDSEINGPGRVRRLPSTAVLGSVLIIRGSDKIEGQAKGGYRDFLMEGGCRGDVREGGREKTQNLNSRCWHLVISKRAVNGAPEFAVRGSLQRCSQPRLAAPDRSERCAVHSVETAAEDKGFGGLIAKCQRRDARRSQRIAAGLEIRVYFSCCALVYGGPSNFDFVGCEACQ